MSKNFIPLHSPLHDATNDQGINSKHPHTSKLSRLQLHTKNHFNGLNRYKGRITSALIVIALLAGGPFAYKAYTHNKMELQTKADAVKQINDANKPYLESPVYDKRKNIFYDRLSPQGHRLIHSARKEMLHNYALNKEASVNAIKRNSTGYSENTSLKTFQSVRNNVKNQTKALKRKNPSIQVRIKGLTAPKDFLPTHVSGIDWEIANLEVKNLAQTDSNLTGKTVSNTNTHTIYAFIKPQVAKSLNVDKYAKRHHVMGKVLKVNSDTTYGKINHSSIPPHILNDTEQIMQQSDSQGLSLVLVAQTPQTKVQKAKAKLANLIAKLKSHFGKHKINGRVIQNAEQNNRNKSTQPLKPDAVHKLTKPKSKANNKRKVQSSKQNHRRTIKPYNAVKHMRPLHPTVRRRTKSVPAPTSYTSDRNINVNITPHKHMTKIPNFLPTSNLSTHYSGYNAVKNLRA